MDKDACGLCKAAAHACSARRILPAMLYPLPVRATSCHRRGAQGRASAREKPFRMPPQKRPYDPLIILEGDDKPPAKGRFSMLSLQSKGPRKHYRHYYPRRPLDWAEIDISKLIARLNRLPAALKNADRYAERLAHSLMNGDYALSEDEARTPSVSVLDWGEVFRRATSRTTALSATYQISGNSLEPVPCEPLVRGNQQRHLKAGGQNRRKRHSTYCPVFFRQLSTWHPPPELSEFTLDDERADLQTLHLHAGDALSACATYK